MRYFRRNQGRCLTFNGNQVLLLNLCHLAHLGDEQAQDTVLELGVNVLLLDLVPHIKAAAAGADEAFPAQIPLVLDAVVVRLLHSGADAEAAVLQLSREVFLMNTGQVNVQLVALVALLDIRVHHAPQGICAECGLGQFIEHILCHQIRGQHKNFSFQTCDFYTALGLWL